MALGWTAACSNSCVPQLHDAEMIWAEIGIILIIGLRLASRRPRSLLVPWWWCRRGYAGRLREQRTGLFACCITTER